VVEDEPTILELLSGSLRFAGFDVVTAATGTEALMMPDRDGSS
jgi:two-component system OmpR family response regulator